MTAKHHTSLESPAAAPLAADPPAARNFTVAVAGNPNCGKTTIFNALTGLRHKVGNYSGVTVEKKEGALAGEPGVRILDLPGTYSLSPRSPDEEIAREVLLGRLEDTPRPDAVLIVIDACNLERNLFLATQIIELGLPAVIACNMMDRVEAAGHRLDLNKLSEALGVPVIRTVGHRKEGLDELRRVLLQLRTNTKARRRRSWTPAPCVEQQIHALATVLRRSGFADETAAEGAAMLLLSEGEPVGNHLPPQVREALADSLIRIGQDMAGDAATELTAGRYTWLSEVVDGCLTRGRDSGLSLTDRLDRVLTHKVWGLILFAAMMAGMFLSIFSLAVPLMEAIETGVAYAAELVNRLVPEGALRGLLTDGVIAGVGNVIVFFPQICILFLFIGLLEDTGYMARAAFLMDRIMNRVGLHGKSFIPLLSSHACAIPGIMATRTIENPRDRLVTILVAPLMSCSARLPVYTVLIGACMPGGALVKAGVMLAMYGLGIVSALSMATLFKKTLLKGPTPAFIMELPPYRMPRPSTILRVMWDRSKLFLQRAGTVILAITIVLWAMMHYPLDTQRTATYESQRAAVFARWFAETRAASHADGSHAATHEHKAIPPVVSAVSLADLPDNLQAEIQEINNTEAADNLRNSFGGRLGHMIEPLIRPLGFDWRIGVGIIASFAAREVFVGTMGIVFSVGEADEESTALRDQLQAAAWPDGRPLFTPLAAVSLMVFYVLACQCASTIAVVYRETNSWRWPLFMFAYMSVLAFTGSLVVYQLGSRLILGHA